MMALPTYDDLMARAGQYPDGRYMKADDVVGDVAPPRTAPDGHCQWCGRELPKRCKKYCPSEVTTYMVGIPSLTRRIQRCAIAFSNWWWGMPRFKRAIYIRDDFTCQLCGVRPIVTNEHDLERPDLSELAIDHIHPFSRGGKTVLENLQVACRPCNGRKHDRVDYHPPEPSEQGSLI